MKKDVFFVGVVFVICSMVLPLSNEIGVILSLIGVSLVLFSIMNKKDKGLF